MPTRTAFATAAVLAGLGGLATAALTARPDGPSATAAATAPPPIVRTTTEVHTITRVRRVLAPAQPHPAAAAAPPPVAASPAPVAAPVARQTPVAQPLRTRASGSAGGSGEHRDDGAEHEQHKGSGRDD